MWDQWKKKIKNLFRDHADENENDAAKIGTRQDNREVQSKVMYHYPKRSSFRFPVIPDEPHEKETPEEPAYKRRETRQTIKNNQESIRQADQQTINYPHQTDRIVKKKTNAPFRPSEVPSPIYGYQKRKKDNDITDVPAYIRKKENKDTESNLLERISNKSSQTNESTFLAEENPDSDRQQTSYENESHIIDDVVDEPVGISDFGNEEIIDSDHGDNVQPEEPLKKRVESDDAFEQRSGPTTESRSRQKKNHKNQKRTGNKQRIKGEEPVPFNVMMSHNDKQHMKQNDRRHSKQLQTKATHFKQTHSNVDEKPVHIPYHLLNDKKETNNHDRLWVRKQQELLNKTFSYFNVDASVVNATQGPSVTRFEVQPAMGVKVSKVKNLSDDIKLNLAAKDIRIEAPIPGKNTIGIEIPNPSPQIVGLQEIYESDAFKNEKSPLTIGLGLTIEGNPSITNIQKMPHGLIAGATGSGKSVCINTILISLLYKADYKSVKFLLIDPKMVELAPYNGIPNLISPVITDVKAATMALKWAVKEMEDRYDRFVQEGVRDIERYNTKMEKQSTKDEKMPYIVIVIDELSDLMMVSPQEVEDAICRIAQKARACGIHLLLATQRPSVDVITGLIKANIPTRIAFSVSSQVDSRTIIDTSGAEKLLGKGDMLFVENGAGKSLRLQGAFVSDDEIERVTDYARSIAEPDYQFEQEQLLERVQTDENEDELLEEAIQFVIDKNNASTSLLQRHFKIGYNRAARLMDSMVQKGIISEQNGSKPREVLVSGASVSE
ncbi:MAG TPA: DNA translocase FtsK [Virgibacillus sp.]|nr:DNA translocase FtsK [Virgibacillus sp.]